VNNTKDSYKQLIGSVVLTALIMVLLLFFILFFVGNDAYAADIQTSLIRVFGNEGGYQNDKVDSGNWTGGKVGVGKQRGTKYGISAASYPKEDIKNLTLKRAAELYERDFWTPLHLSEMKSQGLATEIFDTAVNCGVGTSAVIVSKTINVLNGESLDLKVAPQINSETIQWINDYTKDRTDRVLFWFVLNNFQAKRYLELVQRNPKLQKYLAGWIRRTVD